MEDNPEIEIWHRDMRVRRPRRGTGRKVIQWQFKINTHEEYGKGYGNVWKDFEDAYWMGAENNRQIERDFQGGYAETTFTYCREANSYASRDRTTRTQDESWLRIDFATMEVKNLYTRKLRAARRCQVTQLARQEDSSVE